MVPFADRLRQRGLWFANFRASHSSSPRMQVMVNFLIVVFVPSLSQKWASMGRLSLEARGLDNLIMGNFDSVSAQC